jgi:hypothetical protein
MDGALQLIGGDKGEADNVAVRAAAAAAAAAADAAAANAAAAFSSGLRPEQSSANGM